MVGSPGCGRIALTHIARILPGVSFPSSVVRSIIEIARLSAHSFDAFLIERRLSASTRASTPTWSTAVTRPSRLPSGPGRPSQARMSSSARSRTGESGRRVAVMGRRGYTRFSATRSASSAHPGEWRQVAPVVDEEVVEPRFDDPQVLDPAEGRPRACQLVGLLRDAQQTDRPAMRAKHREERLGLGDRRPDIALGVLDEQRRPDPARIGQWRDLAEIAGVVPRRRVEFELRPLTA